MCAIDVTLRKLEEDEREAFIIENQRAFKYGALVEFGERDGWDDNEEIISRKTIEECLDAIGNDSYRILNHGIPVGGLVVNVGETMEKCILELFYVNPEMHGRGIGMAAWQLVEKCYPETKVWETCTPYFEKRNIHFYVNKCGFQIVEFYNAYHTENGLIQGEKEEEGLEEMFRFEKVVYPS